jgi:hypothetical protein
VRILDMLVRIRIRGSVPRTNGSGSGAYSFNQWPSRRQKKIFFPLLGTVFLKVQLHHFSKIKKVIRKSQNSRNQGFSYYFFLMMKDPDPGAQIHTDPTDLDAQHCTKLKKFVLLRMLPSWQQFQQWKLSFKFAKPKRQILSPSSLKGRKNLPDGNRQKISSGGQSVLSSWLRDPLVSCGHSAMKLNHIR